jgi:predicted CXXCH cytochrome family protein
MQHLPPILSRPRQLSRLLRLGPTLGFALALGLVSGLTRAGPRDGVYLQTDHGSGGAGVNRRPSIPRGHCLQCHETRSVQPTGQSSLFTANDNTLCFTCHQLQGKAVYLGQTSFNGASHWTSGLMRWPGPNPPARPGGDLGLCLNCHTPHGSKDGQGLVPDLGYVREEALCLACHDSTGPARSNLAAEVTKASAHPVSRTAGRHLSHEPGSPASFASPGARHAECADCHNPHASTHSAKLAGVSRVGVTNGAAGAVPAFTFKPATNGSPVVEYELCFKCHSSWTTLPSGAKDTALDFNPANESFHPVEGPGTNSTLAMSNSLAGGTGLPHLTPASVVACGDCHNSDALPATFSTAAAYLASAGSHAPTGPHGSNRSGALLRANYRRTGSMTSPVSVTAEFTLCFICHASAPFSDTSRSTRADTNFKLHGFHVTSKRTLCAACHSSSHATKSAANAGNRSYQRLVSFSGSGTWNQGARSCSVSCHGSESY